MQERAGPPAGHEPGAAPQLVAPDYGGACVASVVPALLRASGPSAVTEDAPTWLPTPAVGASQVVLLVLDGLGLEQLRARATLAPTLSGAAGATRPLTTVAPSTTAAALTSIGTGAPPARHGVLGYRLALPGDEILNVLRWQVGRGSGRDARQDVPVAGIQPLPAFPGATRPVPVVTRQEFGGTGFTAAQIGDSPIFGYRVPSSMVVAVRRLLGAGEPFVYAYYDGIDKVAHEFGVGEHYDAELAAVDRLVADLAGELPPGAALVVTADHGEIDVGGDVVLIGREVMGMTRFLSGEGRFRWLHAVPGAADDLLAACREQYDETTWVRSRDEVVEAGWLGGALREGTAGRLGDVALVPHEPIAFVDPADTGEMQLVGRHGSLTPAEMHVPLVGLGGGGNI